MNIQAALPHPHIDISGQPFLNKKLSDIEDIVSQFMGEAVAKTIQDAISKIEGPNTGSIKPEIKSQIEAFIEDVGALIATDINLFEEEIIKASLEAEGADDIVEKMHAVWGQKIDEMIATYAPEGNDEDSPFKAVLLKSLKTNFLGNIRAYGTRSLLEDHALKGLNLDPLPEGFRGGIYLDDGSVDAGAVSVLGLEYAKHSILNDMEKLFEDGQLLKFNQESINFMYHGQRPSYADDTVDHFLADFQFALLQTLKGAISANSHESSYVIRKAFQDSIKTMQFEDVFEEGSDRDTPENRLRFDALKDLTGRQVNWNSLKVDAVLDRNMNHCFLQINILEALTGVERSQRQPKPEIQSYASIRHTGAQDMGNGKRHRSNGKWHRRQGIIGGARTKGSGYKYGSFMRTARGEDASPVNSEAEKTVEPSEKSPSIYNKRLKSAFKFAARQTVNAMTAGVVLFGLLGTFNSISSYTQPSMDNGAVKVVSIAQAEETNTGSAYEWHRSDDFYDAVNADYANFETEADEEIALDTMEDGVEEIITEEPEDLSSAEQGALDEGPYPVSDQGDDLAGPIVEGAGGQNLDDTDLVTALPPQKPMVDQPGAVDAEPEAAASYGEMKINQVCNSIGKRIYAFSLAAKCAVTNILGAEGNTVSVGTAMSVLKATHCKAVAQTNPEAECSYKTINDAFWSYDPRNPETIYGPSADMTPEEFDALVKEMQDDGLIQTWGQIEPQLS